MDDSATPTATAAIIVADFYEDISAGLLASCEAELRAHDAHDFEIKIYRVQGALEIPFALKHMAGGKPNIMVALGCVIRGETYHFEVVANTAARGILQVQLETMIPIGNGILTVENETQARARLDKGASAARAALAAYNIKHPY